MYNKNAFEMLVPWLEKCGRMKQYLKKYKVTHNVGNAIFHWMCFIPTATIRVRNFKTVDNALAENRMKIILPAMVQTQRGAYPSHHIRVGTREESICSSLQCRKRSTIKELFLR